MHPFFYDSDRATGIPFGCQVGNYPTQSTSEPLRIPITAFHFVEPDDKWPPLTDWIGTLAGFLALGADLRREPVDIKVSVRWEGIGPLGEYGWGGFLAAFYLDFPGIV